MNRNNLTYVILLVVCITLGLSPPAGAMLVPIEVSVADPFDPVPDFFDEGEAPTSTSLYCQRDAGNPYPWACETYGSNFKANRYTIWYCASDDCVGNGYAGVTDGTIDIQFGGSDSVSTWCLHADDGIITNSCMATWGSGNHLVGGDIYHQAVTGYFATRATRG